MSEQNTLTATPEQGKGCTERNDTPTNPQSSHVAYTQSETQRRRKRLSEGFGSCSKQAPRETKQHPLTPKIVRRGSAAIVSNRKPKLKPKAR